MNKLFFFLVLSVLSTTSCIINREKPAPPANPPNPATQTSASPARAEEKAPESANRSSEKAVSKTECTKTDVGDKAVFDKQTFPIDFAPFEGSCFVTSYNPEFDDPPLESEFAVYNGGKKVFDFPSQFNGVTSGCWIEAVAFEDFNGDALEDIAVVGKCGAKMGDYNENMLYVNTGKAFTTDENANYKLADFTRMKEITDYVKSNKQTFFK